MAKPLDPLGLGLNKADPTIMHIDMNSCFASVEQQANPFLRGRPISVSAYNSPKAIILAPSIEAKAAGIKLGMTNARGREICPDLLVLEPDPPKYRDAHMRFMNILRSYTDKVAPKSIDEAVADFSTSQILRRRSMEQIGRDIKQRVKDDIGEWMRVNVGIGTSRWTAKMAAGLHKPDGLDIITHQNIEDMYQQLELRDLTGISWRNEARLNTYGIYTPTDFYHASLQTLRKQVFQSVVGYYWYCELRGWEMQDYTSTRRTFGHTYALGQKTSDKAKLVPMLMKLCEKTGRRLRRHGSYARGIHLSLIYEDHTSWHKGRRIKSTMYATQDIFKQAIVLFNQQPHKKVVTNLTITVYDLANSDYLPKSLFEVGKTDVIERSKAFDEVNDRYGEFTLMPATMLDIKDIIPDRIAFGGAQELEDLYTQKNEEIHKNI